MIIETVKVHFGEGFAIINKSDFDPEKHTLYDPDRQKLVKSPNPVEGPVIDLSLVPASDDEGKLSGDDASGDEE